MSSGYTYGSRATPSQDFIESNPHLRFPTLSAPPPSIEVRYHVGRNDYEDLAMELMKENIPPTP